MRKLKISIVSYLNSMPFLYGIRRDSQLMDKCEMSLDVPSDCAKKVLSGEADVGLVPVITLKGMPEGRVVTDYCISSVGPVKSVILASNVPLEQIKTILLDPESNTSVNLVKILAKESWDIEPIWKSASKGFEQFITGTTAGVIIGDRALSSRDGYKYVYDLSEEWQKLTGLPFVFAVWMAAKDVSDEFIEMFNKALKHGVDSRGEIVDGIKDEQKKLITHNYLFECIQYQIDDIKKQSIDLFLEKATSLSSTKPLT